MTGSSVSLVESRPIIYGRALAGREFRQGEILSDVSQFVFDQPSVEITEILHPYVIIASQDCDLLWDFESRKDNKGAQLNGILLYEAHDALKYRAQVPGSDIWKRIIQNKDERYHALESAAADFDLKEIGIPDLIVDFKRFFCLSPDQLSLQCSPGGGADRRCILEMPFREHFQSRAAFYMQRVSLPSPHKIGKT